MESRLESAPATNESHVNTIEKLVGELKAIVQRAQQTTVERAKAADRVVRTHPYQTIGMAFGLGLLVGILARRK